MHSCTHDDLCVCVCLYVWMRLPFHSHHLISSWIDSCNADSFHLCYSRKQPITASAAHGTWWPQRLRDCVSHCVRVCVYVCLSLTAVPRLTLYFLTHLQHKCNLAHWTFKLLDVTSKGIGGGKTLPFAYCHLLCFCPNLCLLLCCPVILPATFPWLFHTAIFFSVWLHLLFSSRLYWNLSTVLQNRISAFPSPTGMFAHSNHN